MRKTVLTVLSLTLSLGVAASAAAHCQIPCGIYDDELRVQLIEEHIGTIEKSMKQIAALGAEDPVNHNQLVRWVINKDEHAQEIQDIVTAYFMAQRIKHPSPDASDEDKHAFIAKLGLAHAIQVTAMKAKQTTDPATVEKLRKLTKKFRAAYFGEAEPHDHH